MCFVGSKIKLMKSMSFRFMVKDAYDATSYGLAACLVKVSYELVQQSRQTLSTGVLVRFPWK